MSDIFLMGCTQRREAFRLLSASTQQSEFIVVPIGTRTQKYLRHPKKKRGHHKFWKESGAISTLHT
jgi:hypothetical protein